MLPDRSVIKGQKLVENAKIKKKSNATFCVIFKQCAHVQLFPVFENVSLYILILHFILNNQSPLNEAL